MSRDETFNRNRNDHIREGDSTSKRIKPGVSIKLKSSQRLVVDDIIEQNRATLVALRTLSHELMAQEEELWSTLESWYPELVRFHTTYNWRDGIVEVLEEISEEEIAHRERAGHAAPPFGEVKEALALPLNKIVGDAPKHDEVERAERLVASKFAGKLRAALESLRESLNEEEEDE